MPDATKNFREYCRNRLSDGGPADRQGPSCKYRAHSSGRARRRIDRPQRRASHLCTGAGLIPRRAWLELRALDQTRYAVYHYRQSRLWPAQIYLPHRQLPSRQRQIAAHHRAPNSCKSSAPLSEGSNNSVRIVHSDPEPLDDAGNKHVAEVANRLEKLLREA